MRSGDNRDVLAEMVFYDTIPVVTMIVGEEHRIYVRKLVNLQRRVLKASRGDSRS